jgi:methylated-DNA-protein-cysteine methyltransferase-like protein
MTDIPFYEQVYAVVRQIPAGQVTSYGRVAEMLGYKGRARQVGYAMSALKHKDGQPAYENVPWQRVVNFEGRITIKGSRHGRITQAELLKAEGIKVNAKLQVDMKKYLWDGLLPHEIQALLKQISPETD